MASTRSSITLLGPAPHCCGEVVPPGDKSISHRAFLLAALAKGTSTVVAPLDAEDTRSTIKALRMLGARIDVDVDVADKENKGVTAVWRVHGLAGNLAPPRGAESLASPQAVPTISPSAHTVALPTIDCGNSGTSLRLLLGALAGAGMGATFTGDASLMQRPMRRVVDPLRLMGADVSCSSQGCAPVCLQPATRAKKAAAPLTPIDYALPIASAQVKSALLLAALGAQGRTLLRGRIDSRDHTERMLACFGVTLERTKSADGSPALQLDGPQALLATSIAVPGDPSSAAFFWTAAALVPNGDVTVRNVSLNPTRLGFLRVLVRMGAEVNIVAQPQTHDHEEPVGTVRVQARALHGVQINAHEVPDVIDELPLVTVLACHARGLTQVRGAQELRCKESDRIAAMAHNCQAVGASFVALADGFDVEGGSPLHGAQLQSFADHRIAMACAILALVAEGPSTLHGADCVAVSYPDFFTTLQRLTSAVRESL